VRHGVGCANPVTRHVCTHEAIRRVDRAAGHQVRLVPSWTLLRPRGALDSCRQLQGPMRAMAVVVINEDLNTQSKLRVTLAS